MNLPTVYTAGDLFGHSAITSSLPSVRERQPRIPALVLATALAAPATSSAGSNWIWEAPLTPDYDTTTSSSPPGVLHTDHTRTAADEATRRAIAELRRVSGLSWDQIAELFRVTRRSVHFWASGKPLSAANEHRLMQALDVIRTADRGNARANRAAILEVKDGLSALQLLADERFDDARARLGAGKGRRRLVLSDMSAEAKAARAPLPPDTLIDARHERAHRDLGGSRPARTLRSTRRETP